VEPLLKPNMSGTQPINFYPRQPKTGATNSLPPSCQ
jgi:hypothetical protein